MARPEDHPYNSGEDITLEFSFSTRTPQMCDIWWYQGEKLLTEDAGNGWRIVQKPKLRSTIISQLILDGVHNLEGTYIAKAIENFNNKVYFLNSTYNNASSKTFTVRRNPPVPVKPTRNKVTTLQQDEINNETKSHYAPKDHNDENQVTSFRGGSSVESTKTSSGGSSQGSTMAIEPGHDGNVGRQLSRTGEEIKESDNKELVATVKSLEKKIADMQIDNGELLRNITSTITKSMNTDLKTYRENASSALKKNMEYTNQCLEKTQGDITSSINHSISELQKRIDQQLRTSSDETVKNINNNIGGLQLEMKNIKKSLDDISQEYKTVQSQISHVQTANQNMKQDLTKAIQAHTSDSASSINSFTDNQIKSLRVDVVGLNNTFVQFINIEQKKWTHNKRELEARINKLEEEKEQFLKENHQLQTEKRTLEKSNLSNEKDIASLNRTIKKNEVEIETKISQLSERDSVIENLNAQKQRDKNELIGKDKTIAAKNESIKEYESQLRQLKQKLKELTDEATEYKEEAIGYKEKLDEANGKVSELEQKLNEPPITVLVPLPIFMDDRLQPIIRGIQEQFQTQGVKMTFFPKDPSQIQPTDVVILPSIIASRVGSDIAATFNLAQLKSNVKVLMIVFNHLAPHNANIATPTKERLNDPSISARCHSIIDMVFWQGKVLDCQVNKDAAAKISKYSRKLIARNK